MVAYLLLAACGTRVWDLERGCVMCVLWIDFLLKLIYKTLPETRSFPCARIFAVCTISGTRQRAYLPCATKGTHGKLNGTRQRSCLPCATKKTHGKAVDTRQCRMFAVCHDLQHTAKKKHTAKCILCRVLRRTHSKMWSLPCVYFWHTANLFKKIQSAFETFLLIFILYVGLYTRFWYFSRSFCYI